MIDPASLNIPIADSAEIVSFEDRYESAIRIPCCISSCRTLHNKGIVVRLRNGELSRVGHHCGKRLLGSAQFTVLQRDYQQRQQRAIRERFISSPTFDPEGALAALPSWTERVDTIRRVRKLIEKHSPGLLNDLQIANEKQDGWFQVENDRGVLLKVKLRGTKFLSTRWEDLFENAVSDVRIIVRVCRRQKLSDAELRNVVFKASDSVRRLSIVAEIIEPFGQFLEALAYLMETDLYASFGPLDRSPIEKLMVGDASSSANVRAPSVA